MTDYAGDFLAGRFAAVANDLDDSDWSDVLRRAGEARVIRRRRILRSRRALLVVAAFCFVLGFLLVAPAFGLRIISPLDFFSAKHAPPRVVMDFGKLQVGAPPGMAPGVLPHQARRVAAFRLASGRTSILYVAPTKSGGFCFEWTRFAGGCLGPALTRKARPDLSAASLLAYNVLPLTTQEGAKQGIVTVAGQVRQYPHAVLRIEYRDGTSTVIPVLWVSKPINAGFFLFPVPKNHRLGSTQAVAVTLTQNGKTIIKEPLTVSGRDDVPHKLQGGRTVLVPANAVWARRSLVVDFRATNGTRIRAWVAPSRSGGTCYWFNRGAGCPPPGELKAAFRTKPLLLGISGGRPVLLQGQVAPQIARVELRFQDASRQTITPTHGLLLIELTPQHYALGHRLVTAIGYDSQGHIVGRWYTRPGTPGIYPCESPKNYDYGLKQCP